LDPSGRAEKVDGKPQALQPPAAERLEVRVPTLVMVGEVDEPNEVAVLRPLWRVPSSSIRPVSPT
jgi:hypothetical protein